MIKVILLSLCVSIAGWFGSCAYQDYKEFTDLKPKCEAVSGTRHKIGGDWVCVGDLLKGAKK